MKPAVSWSAGTRTSSVDCANALPCPQYARNMWQSGSAASQARLSRMFCREGYSFEDTPAFAESFSVRTSLRSHPSRRRKKLPAFDAAVCARRMLSAAVPVLSYDTPISSTFLRGVSRRSVPGLFMFWCTLWLCCAASAGGCLTLSMDGGAGPVPSPWCGSLTDIGRAGCAGAGVGPLLKCSLPGTAVRGILMATSETILRRVSKAGTQDVKTSSFSVICGAGEGLWREGRGRKEIIKAAVFVSVIPARMSGRWNHPSQTA